MRREGASARWTRWACSTQCVSVTLAGEHTDEVRRELGYDAAAIAALRADQVV